jgi:hypothetical protein
MVLLEARSDEIIENNLGLGTEPEQFTVHFRKWTPKRPTFNRQRSDYAAPAGYLKQEYNILSFLHHGTFAKSCVTSHHDP